VANEALSGHPRICLSEPLDVLAFHNILSRAYLVLTDSGGIQEEAPALGKPVLVLRDVTERGEGVAAGTLRLLGTKEASVYHGFTELLTSSSAYQTMASAINPYGDGTASRKIADILATQENF
jgi:UDP-N-acetylglucosamine 2-epimerase (non-hydrolysing)